MPSKLKLEISPKFQDLEGKGGRLRSPNIIQFLLLIGIVLQKKKSSKKIGGRVDIEMRGGEENR